MSVDLCVCVAWSLGSLVVRALDLRLDGRELSSQPPWLVLGCVTIIGWANDLSISPSYPGQLNLLPSSRWEMGTSQSMLCGGGLKAGMAQSTCGYVCGCQVKLSDPLLTCTIPERLRDEQLIIKH